MREVIVPAEIDPTGTVDVSDPLNDWLAAEVGRSGELGDDLTVVLPDGARYRCEYGLTVGCKAGDDLHPATPAYEPVGVTIAGNGATILHTDDTPWRVVRGPDGRPVEVIEPRRRWGVQMLRTIGGSYVTVRDLALVSTNRGVRGSVGTLREAWSAIQVRGTAILTLVDVDVTDVWGDFCYVANVRPSPSSPLYPARDMVVEGGRWSGAGRQGIVPNAVDGLVFSPTSVDRVRRFVIDVEPTRTGRLTRAHFRDFATTGGNLGLMQVSAGGQVAVGDVSLTGVTVLGGTAHVSVPTSMFDVDGDGRRDVVRRSGLTIADVTADEAWQHRQPMIVVGGWDDVRVERVRATVRPDRAVRLRDCTGPGEVDCVWTTPEKNPV